MELDVVELARRLVAIPSVNPMGMPREGPVYGECRVTEFLVALAQKWGLPCERWEVHPGRENVLLRLEGASPNAPLLLLDAHQDTVPVDGMTIAPFEPEVRAGRLYGRGACDIKGGLAVLLAVLARAARHRAPHRPHLVVSATVNEEHGFSGAKRLAELFESGESRLLPYAPSACVVLEPTRLNVVVAHKGVVRWRIHTQGRAAHSSQPERGQNAIYRMAPVLQALETYARETVSGLAAHPLVGSPTLSVGVISGGLSVNTVPDRCTIEIDRRLVPGECPRAARQHVIDYLASMAAATGPLEHEAASIVSAGLDNALNLPLAAALARQAQSQGHACQVQGVPYGTNAAALGPRVPTVVFGPGDIAQAHTADEFVEIEQLRAAVDILAGLVGTSQWLATLRGG